MRVFLKVIKYLAIALAIVLVVTVVRGIVKTVGHVGDFLEEGTVTGEMKTYPVDSEIRNLDLRIGAADIQIKEGEAFLVESNLKHLRVEEKNDTLIIEQTKTIGINDRIATLTLYVPAGTVFARTDLKTGAGRLTAGEMTAEIIDFELGAADVTIETLTATESADVEGGAGRITVSGGTLNDLELEMGVGQLNLTAVLTGDCQMDLGVGQSNLTLLGEKEDYRLDLTKGVGKITVDGQEVVRYENSGNGTNKVEINGGVGAIDVKFDTATQ